MDGYERSFMSLGLCRLSAETNAVSSGVHGWSTEGEMPSGPFDMWMSIEDRAPLIVFLIELNLLNLN